MRGRQYSLYFALAMIGFVPAASAADMPVKAPPSRLAPPTYNWTGFYIGGDVGYGWGKSTGVATSADGFFPTPYNFKATGAIGGGYLGYNHQLSQIVIGIEADWQAANLEGNSGPFVAFGSTYNYSTDIKNYGSVRGRLGYAMDRWLIFATGGYAWGSWSTSYAFTGPPFYTNKARESGWTVGGGIEYSVTNNWLARVEYRYTDLGASKFVAGSGFVLPNLAETGNGVTINDVRVGVAYKFGGS